MSYTLAEGDNRQLAMDMVRKAARRKITYPQMTKIFDDAGIDSINAIYYYNENSNKNGQTLTINVYHGLIEFVKKNREKDIFVDEFPILMNPKSKIYLFFKKLFLCKI